MTERILGEHFNAGGRPKRRFPSEEAALKHIEKHHLNMIVYPCSFCKGWHLATPQEQE